MHLFGLCHWSIFESMYFDLTIPLLRSGVLSSFKAEPEAFVILSVFGI